MKRVLSTIKHQKEIKLIKESGLFDEHYYVTHYPEVKQSGLTPIEHYVKIGSAAGMKPNAYFDDAFYRDSNPDLKGSSANPLVHFIKYGAREGRDPSRSFKTRFYLERHPDVARTGVNPLWHFLNYGLSEQREIDNARDTALGPENQALYRELQDIEPLLPPFENLRYVPLLRAPTESLAGRAYFKLREALSKPFSHLLVLRWLIHGGASTLAMYHARLIAERLSPDSVVVLLVDDPGNSAAHLLPHGVRMVALDDLQPGLTGEDRVQVLARLIIEAQPQVVHNIESDIGWRAIERYHRQFSGTTALIGSIFMFCYNEAGIKVGNAVQYLNSCLDHLDILFTDNHDFKREACKSYALEKHNQDKMVVVYTPILSRFYPPDPDGASSKRILWSSRLHPDKRPDLLLAIARCMPDFTFEVYGGAAMSGPELEAIEKQANIRLHGPYRSSEDLPRAGIAAYLHTARHEGGAITLKEALAAGLPVIGPPIGLISEIVNPDTGWLVTRVDDPAAYAAAIRDCLSDPDERVRRVCNGQELLKKEHSWESFERAVGNLPAYRLPPRRS